eukprot:jgi/Psemu1/202303/e_gw1.295.27.1
MRGLLFAIAGLVASTTTTRAWSPSTGGTPVHGSHCSSRSSLNPLFLSSGSPEGETMDGKTKLATDLARLFDIGQMAYTVMVREEQKGPDGKLTPEQLIAAIQKDSMFGEEFEEYCTKYCDDDKGESVRVLDIGKFADDMESSEPLPEEYNLTIQGKGNYLVHVSFTDEIFATMRIVVD